MELASDPTGLEKNPLEPISHQWLPPMSIFIHIHQTTQTYQANERQITLSACNVEKMMRNWSSLVGRAICSPKIVLATPCQQRLLPSFVVFLSPLGDLEMNLSGDIQSNPIPQHFSLIVPNVFKPFNTDQVQPSSVKYSQVQPRTAK